MNIPVVYEDAEFMVLDKPCGLLVVPTPKKESCTLTSILNENLEDAGFRLYPCHRLDRETSGLIIYAKGKAAQEKMMDEFRRRAVKKRYIAFVRGSPPGAQGEIKKPIEGKSAFTGYKVIEKRRDFAIVEVVPLTGRTNQIRIHFKQIGAPVLGESKYAFRRDFKVRASRLCLHAQDLEFRHPFSNKMIRLHAPLPESLKKFLSEHD